MALALPPWGWWPLAPLGLITLELLVAGERSRRRRFALAWCFAFVWLGLGMGWMWFLTQPGYIVAAAIFGVYHGTAAALAPTGRWAAVGRPAAHTLAEALRMCFPFGGVPLATLGISQASSPLAQLARVGGVLLITWVLWQVAASAAGAIHARRLASNPRSGQTAWLAIPAAACLVALGLAWVAPRGHETGQSLRMAVVQGGGPQGTRASDTGTELVFQRHLEATRQLQPDQDLDLVLWPENVIDTGDVPFTESPQLDDVAAEAGRLGVPFSVGVTEDAGPGHFTNAQYIVMPNGDVTGRYDKVRRVPFGEYIPLRGLLNALNLPVDQVPTDARAGTGPAYLDLGTAEGDVRLAVAISWEVFFGGRARDGVGHGGQVVLNPTNGSSYTWTILQSQQVASSRLRAIETGRWVVQAAPTGFSTFVSPDGDVLDRTGVSERRLIVRDIALRTGDTWYVRIGDKPIVALAGVVLAVAWWCARRRQDQPTEPATPPASA